MLAEGAGVAPTPTEAARYNGLAAEQNLPAAQIDYATLLYLGQGIDKDVAKAAMWYSRAAETGNAVAQNRYAKLLAAGEGVTLNLEDAAMWRSLARRQGLSDAALDRMLVSIPAEALARAEERARFWPSEPPGTASANADPTDLPAIGDPILPSPMNAQNAPAPAEEPAGAPAVDAPDTQAPRTGPLSGAISPPHLKPAAGCHDPWPGG